MHEQILHLIRLAQSANLTIQIIPASIPFSWLLAAGPYAVTILDFAGSPQRRIVHTEGHFRSESNSSNLFEAVSFARAFEQLAGQALDVQASLRYLRETSETLLSLRLEQP